MKEDNINWSIVIGVLMKRLVQSFQETPNYHDDNPSKRTDLGEGKISQSAIKP